MSLHKLSAGNGYTYLTRQVAAADATDKGRTPLGEFYAQRGESPGVWVGSGLSGLDGVDAGAQVSSEQMLALFGEGRHPDADKIGAAMIAAGHRPAQAERASALGRRYYIFDQALPLRVEVARRFAEHNGGMGRRRNARIPPEVRTRIRTDAGAQMFALKHGRPPEDSRELHRFIARYSRRAKTAVAGYDLTFSPVKSVSSVWAIAPPKLAAAIQQAHGAAVADTLSWLERAAAFTRTGPKRASQIQPTALIGTAFTHRDARSGDPDLHTHVAISNKVQSRDGAWQALHGRVLVLARRAASERYDTRMEAELRARLGVRFRVRAGDEPSRRIREVVGVDPALSRFWSSRRADIEVRLAVLSAAFQVDHGRRPTAIESVRLAQTATLQTRPPKHSPGSYAEQRATWSAQAERVLGSEVAVQEMISAALPGLAQTRSASGQWVPARSLTGQWVDDMASQVHATVSGLRPTWNVWDVRAEVERQARSAEVALVDLDVAVEAVVARALSPAHCVPVGGRKHPGGPGSVRADGSSVYTLPGAQRFTSQAVMDARAAQDAQVAPASAREGHILSDPVVETAGSGSAGERVNPAAQRPEPVPQMATGARVQPAIAPAGPDQVMADPEGPAPVASLDGAGDESRPRQLPAGMFADLHATGEHPRPAAEAGEVLAGRTPARAEADRQGNLTPPPTADEGAPTEPHLVGSDDRDLHADPTLGLGDAPPPSADEAPPGQSPPQDEGYHEALFHAARQREYAPAPDLDEIDTDRQLSEANRWDHAPIPRTRLLELNEMAADFFTAGYPRSWGPGYLVGRLGTDLADHRGFRFGYAPAGWTNLTDHLRRLGARDDEILGAGLGRVASTGRVIDQFRDRLVLPVRNGDQIHGFIGRRNPTLADADNAGPRYLNTAHTDLFDKGAQLFGLSEGRAELDAGASPVLVEGFFDAIAVTLVGAGRYIGLAPLGTSLTAAQANALRPYIGAQHQGVAVATDADLAGQIGAQRAFWMLSARGDRPRLVAMPEGQDPAAVLQHGGAAVLLACLHDARPLARLLLDERLTHRGQEAKVLSDCAAVIAAQPPDSWMEQIEFVAARTHLGPDLVQHAVADAAQRWSLDPLGRAQDQISELAAVRARMQHPANAPLSAPSACADRDLVPAADAAAKPRPNGRLVAATSSQQARPAAGTPAKPLTPPQAWRELAHSIDSRLTAGEDWPLLCRAIQEADAAGCDVARELGRLAGQGQIPAEGAATELAYRLRAATQTFSDIEPNRGRRPRRAAPGLDGCAQPDTRTSRRPASPPAG